MATFVMLSSAASTSGNNEFHPTPYQFFFLSELLGDSPKKALSLSEAGS